MLYYGCFNKILTFKLKLKHIKTHLNKFIFYSSGKSKIKNTLFKKTGFLRSDGFGFWSTIVFVFLLLVFKGSIGEGQPTLFSRLISKSIEETSASVLSKVQPQSDSQLADLSTLSALGYAGQGGQDNITVTAITPLPINDNAFMAHNPISTDYIETSSGQRSQVAEYVVQEGDLLSFIASDFGVSVESIIWANKDLKDADSLKPGQSLKIPPISGVVHEVVKGDTLASIAKKYGANEVKISEFNTLPKSGELRLGDVVIVPDGQIKSSPTYIASSVSTKTTATPFSYLPNLGDYFMLPTSGYNWGRIHGRNGVDIANSCGTPIYAAAEGSVTVSDGVGYNGGFGKYIKIVHPNNTETLYAHATKLLVSQGEYAQRGQMIALMGSTGRSTGCHLHFEVHGARNPLVK